MTQSYRPKKGLKIPMPDRGFQLLPESGLPVDLGNPFYRRLLADGDIVAVEPETPAPAAPRKPKRI